MPKIEEAYDFFCEEKTSYSNNNIAYKPTEIVRKGKLVHRVFNAIHCRIMRIPLIHFLKVQYRPHFSLQKYFTRLPKEIETVTAVVPNYNYAHFLPERIRSIVNQKYPISELIILDDCSRDNSLKVIEEVVKELKNTHPNLKIQVVISEKNSGKVFNQWAKAFELATSDYVWICEADDLCSPYFLKRVMPVFKQDKRVVVSYSESCMVDENGKRLMSDFRGWVDYQKSGHWNKDFIINGKDDLKKYQVINNTIANVSGVVFKKDPSIPFAKYLETAKAFRLAGDWYFYSKVLLHGKLAYCAESLNTYRSHSDSVSKVTDNVTHYREIVRVQDSIMSDLPISQKTKEIVMRHRKELREEWHLSDDLINYATIPLEDLYKKDKTTTRLLSVIVPVYRTKKYLKTCLDSILKDFPDYSEIIVIDDASNDGTEKVLEGYPKEKVIFKKLEQHQGVSAARNYGLKIAKGRYVAFVDSDDYADQYMFSTLLKKAIDSDADIVHCDIMLQFPNGGTRVEKMESAHYDNQLANILDCVSVASPCNKIYKRTLFDKYAFPKMDMNEDVAIIPQLILAAKTITYIPSPLYYYVQRSSSTQHEKFSKKRLAIFDSIEHCLKGIGRDSDIYEMVAGLLISHQVIQTMIWITTDEKDKKYRRHLLKLFLERLVDYNLRNIYIKNYASEINMPKLIEVIETTDEKYFERYVRNKCRINHWKSLL